MDKQATDFFNQIVYSAANEDGRSELIALDIQPSDRVLCITGSGARPLDLLTVPAKDVISIDFNIQQAHLLQLKCAAYSQLDYDTFLAFIGVDACQQRRDIFQTKLMAHLPQAPRLFWQQRLEKIAQGILYCGLWETYLRRLAWLGNVRSPILKKLAAAKDVSEQFDIWENDWKGPIWNSFMALIGQRWVWKYIFKEPGIEQVEDDLDIAGYMKSRFDHIMATQLIRTNPFLNLILYGRYHREALPLHLQAQSFDTIKSHLSQLTVITDSLESYLNHHPNTIDAFSLSDFSSYADPEGYQQTWAAVINAAKPNARVCERFFLAPYQPDRFLSGQISRNATLENRLFEQDYSFIYRFNIATVKA